MLSLLIHFKLTSGFFKAAGQVAQLIWSLESISVIRKMVEIGK